MPFYPFVKFNWDTLSNLICHLKKALLPKSIKIIDLWYLSKGLCIWKRGHAGIRATRLSWTDLLRVYMRWGKLLQLWKNPVLYTLISLWPVHILAWLSFVPPALPSYKQIPLPSLFISLIDFHGLVTSTGPKSEYACEIDFVTSLYSWTLSP